MSKATIYLPDDLDRRVREAGISMSPVCQSALEAEVCRVQGLAKDRQEIERVAKRLKGTRPKEVRLEKYRKGFDFGVRWAKHSASFTELRDIAQRAWPWPVESFSVDWDHSLADDLAAREESTVSADGSVWLDWKDPWVQGLCDGAEKVYRDVLPHLQH
jgi:hypothetical protein